MVWLLQFTLILRHQSEGLFASTPGDTPEWKVVEACRKIYIWVLKERTNPGVARDLFDF